MNKERRVKLKSAIADLQSARNIMDTVLDAEQDAMDNVPENLQETERYEQFENAVDILDDACSQVDDIIDSVRQLVF